MIEDYLVSTACHMVIRGADDNNESVPDIDIDAVRAVKHAACWKTTKNCLIVLGWADNANVCIGCIDCGAASVTRGVQKTLVRGEPVEVALTCT